MSKIYEFWHETEHLLNKRGYRRKRGVDYDMTFIPLNADDAHDLKYDSFKAEITLTTYPEVLYFKGDLTALRTMDYPIIEGDFTVLVVSKRLLALLTAIKPFAYKAIPVIIYDAAYTDYPFTGNPFLQNFASKGDVPINTDFVFIKLLRHFSMDKDNSVFTLEPFMGKELFTGIKKLEVLEPEDGLDPLFRIKEKCINLFITDDARQEIERQGINGVICEEIHNIP
ncbi:hypothetical protein FACS189461_5400 [Spirochaetia bacterium]|nr:hypothetical protein FACS189461_5400 [Spirochaetia bacterium]